MRLTEQLGRWTGIQHDGGTAPNLVHDISRRTDRVQVENRRPRRNYDMVRQPGARSRVRRTVGCGVGDHQIKCLPPGLLQKARQSIPAALNEFRRFVPAPFPPGCGTGLRIHVEHQDPHAVERRLHRQVYTQRRLSRPALLSDHPEHFHPLKDPPIRPVWP